MKTVKTKNDQNPNHNQTFNLTNQACDTHYEKHLSQGNTMWESELLEKNVYEKVKNRNDGNIQA